MSVNSIPLKQRQDLKLPLNLLPALVDHYIWSYLISTPEFNNLFLIH